VVKVKINLLNNITITTTATPTPRPRKRRGPKGLLLNTHTEHMGRQAG
jgi:hypothetical protein